MTKDVNYDPSLPAIQLDGYDLSGLPDLILLNNGHTCKSVGLFSLCFATLNELCYCGKYQREIHVAFFCPLVQLQLPNTMRIVKGFDQVFLAAQLHFHWGNTAVPGSEHTIDKVHFPAEVRMRLPTANSTVYNINHRTYFYELRILEATQWLFIFI